MVKIRYKDGFKYQLSQDYGIDISISPINPIKTPYIELNDKGALLIRKGYCWDGASGPVPDTKANMHASLVHDALYQLMRCGELSGAMYKTKADNIFMVLCISDGVPAWIARSYFRGLKWFGNAATLSRNSRRVITAP